MFTGGCNVGINTKANKIVCNDIEVHVIEFLKACKDLDSKYMLEKIHNIIEDYQLSKTNQEGYLDLRKEYNEGNQSWDIFYTLLCYSFNNQLRFNSKGGFNMPFGKDRSSFNPTLEQKFITFVDSLKNKNIEFTNMDFNKLKIDKLDNESFVYADPPYLITCATYNEKDGWNETKERELLQLLDNLNEKNIRFALSNVLENKGKSNDILKEWSKKYKVNYLNNTYSNCSYQVKDKSKGTTIEVLITNY